MSYRTPACGRARACRRARSRQFRHNDVAHAERLPRHRATNRHALIVTDGVFSMDGDLAPLNELSELARAKDAWLMSDDAHGLGVLGGGRGSAFAIGASVDLQMGTLVESARLLWRLCLRLGGGDRLLKTRARTFIYSTGLPPASVAAAWPRSNHRDRPGTNRAPARKSAGLHPRLQSTASQSQIVPVVLGDPGRAESLAPGARRASWWHRSVRRRCPKAPRGCALPSPRAIPSEIARLAEIMRERIRHERLFHHRDWNRCRQDLRRRWLVAACASAESRCGDKARGQRFRHGAGAGERSGRLLDAMGEAVTGASSGFRPGVSRRRCRPTWPPRAKTESMSTSCRLLPERPEPPRRF